MGAKNGYSERFWEMIDIKKVEDSIIKGGLGISRSLECKTRSGAQSVSIKTILKALELFPDVNANYILSGRGSMFIDEEPISVLNKPEKGAIPYYKELPVSAGKHELLRQYIENEGSHGWIKLPDVTAMAAFPVKGCSMKPYINDGDFIAIARVERWESVEPDKIYMIVTKDDRMIKHLVKDEEEDSFLWAMSPNYPRFKVFKHDIIEIYRVVFSGRMV